jgi:predicted permease
LLLLISALAVWLLARVLRWPRAVTGALLLTVPLGNTSYLGYPLTRALLGDAALPYAVAYDQFGSFLILSTYGVVVLAVYAHGVHPRPLHILRRVFTFPAFLALLLALAIAPAPLPHWLTAMLQPLAVALLPLVALAIGLQLKLVPDREHLGALASGLLLKMLALPALALLLAPLLGLHGAAAQAGVLESAMPPMITAAALASMAGLAPKLAAAMVSYGIVLMLLILPLGLRLLQ